MLLEVSLRGTTLINTPPLPNPRSLQPIGNVCVLGHLVFSSLSQVDFLIPTLVPKHPRQKLNSVTFQNSINLEKISQAIIYSDSLRFDR